MHLAEAAAGRRAFHWADTIEICAHGPAPRPARMTGYTDSTSEARARAVGGNNEPARQPAAPAIGQNLDSVYAPVTKQRLAHQDLFFYAGAGRARRVDQRMIETMPREDAALLTGAVRPLAARAIRPSHDHAVHRQRPGYGAAKREPIENCHRPWIHGVATQLEAWKPRAVEHTYVDAGARQHDCRYRPGRAGADDKDVAVALHGSALPSTIALFFEPKPRQLHRAAVMCASRPVFGMKSRSQSGSASD